MIRRLMRWLLGCPHGETYRERRAGGQLFLVCWHCGHAVPAIIRTPKELRAVLRQRPAHATARAKPVRPATVLPVTRGKR